MNLPEYWYWIGIGLCITQSATFSGCNLAFFRLGRLELELEARRDPRAARVLKLRGDSNFLLATILWGNVAVNVLLALLADSVLAGVMAFLFSTVVITWLGEIMPQAYFSRYPLSTASLMAPLIRIYQYALYPVTRPTGMFLDWWLGKENIRWLREPLLRDILKAHVRSPDTEVSDVEGIGALNFLDIDDLSTATEGEVVQPESIIEMPVDVDLPRFPEITRDAGDPFLTRINATSRKWAILVDSGQRPQLALDIGAFTRDALYGKGTLNPYRHCHRPIVVEDPDTSLGDVIRQLTQTEKPLDSGVIADDVVLVWGKHRRIITGSDILGRLLTGIGQTKDVH